MVHETEIYSDGRDATPSTYFDILSIDNAEEDSPKRNLTWILPPTSGLAG